MMTIFLDVCSIFCPFYHPNIRELVWVTSFEAHTFLRVSSVKDLSITSIEIETPKRLLRKQSVKR